MPGLSAGLGAGLSAGLSAGHSQCSEPKNQCDFLNLITKKRYDTHVSFMIGPGFFFSIECDTSGRSKIFSMEKGKGWSCCCFQHFHLCSPLGSISKRERISRDVGLVLNHPEASPN